LAGEEELTKEQLLDEEVMLGLRSTGIDLEHIRTAYGVDLEEENASEMRRLVADGMATMVGARFRLTSKGYLISDEISGSFLARVAGA
jgi:coproporphyrinogen III oxidase-like Fe-S oxidoreductase